jgi:hypothetical protein
MTSHVSKVILTLLLSLSVPAPGSPKWKTRVRAIVFSTLLQVWRLSKLVYRGRGQGAIARASEALVVTDGLTVDKDEVRFEDPKIRMLVWRIGSCLVKGKLMRHGISVVGAVG